MSMSFFSRKKFKNHPQFKSIPDIQEDILKDILILEKDPRLIGNDLSVYVYEKTVPKGQILYHGTPFANVQSILTNGFNETSIFTKENIEKIIPYVLPKTEQDDKYGAILKLEYIGEKAEPIWNDSMKIDVNRCRLIAVYKIKINSEKSQIRRQKGTINFGLEGGTVVPSFMKKTRRKKSITSRKFTKDRAKRSVGISRRRR